eukprot:1498738-Prymnesium_polylepis.1
MWACGHVRMCACARACGHVRTSAVRSPRAHQREEEGRMRREPLGLGAGLGGLCVRDIAPVRLDRVVAHAVLLAAVRDPRLHKPVRLAHPIPAEGLAHALARQRLAAEPMVVCEVRA